MKTNKRGFTLIEIIVSIAIAAVVLTLIGGIMFSSWSFLGNTTQSDSYKLKMDEIVSVIRTDTQYATDVRFVKEDSRYSPDYETDKDWHYLYIKDGKLYRDGKLLLDKGYYEDTNVSIFLRGYKDSNHRMDFNYKLLDSNRDTLYSTKDTVMFLNLSLPDEIAEKAFITSDNEYELSINGYWLFYTKKSTITKPTEPTKPTTQERDGTVGDIRFNINWYNYGGLYDTENSDKYSSGVSYQNLIVWYNGEWWERINNWSSGLPGEGTGWRLLNKNYTSPLVNDTTKKTSVYKTGDIVVYNGNYYQAKRDFLQPEENNVVTNSDAWYRLDLSKTTDAEILKNKTYAPSIAFHKNTVAKTLWPTDINMMDPLYPTVELFQDNVTYKEGNIVKVKNSNDDSFYDLYYNRGKFGKKEGPGTPESGWTKISNYYDCSVAPNNYFPSLSYYEEDDIVFAIKINDNKYIQANRKVFKTGDSFSYNSDSCWVRID